VRVGIGILCLLVLAAGVEIAVAKPKRASRSAVRFEEERPTDARMFVWRLESSPRRISSYNNFTSYQVNVDGNGNNIVGDAANEPSLAVNPNNPAQMSIAWRQFNTVQSNFRQGGFAYSANSGTSWTFPGVLDSSFRSDPVLQTDFTGRILFLSLVPGFFDDIWSSSNGGQSYSRIGPALGGDKQWFVVDNTNSSGRGYLYQIWSFLGNNWNGRQFTRSLDSGATWMDPIELPNQPSFGTIDVDNAGNVYVGGANTEDGEFWCVRSTNAKNPAVTPTFDQVTLVDLGGRLGDIGSTINPAGLIGQAYLAVDRSGTSSNNNVYMLASLQRSAAIDGADVMFARSTNGGSTFTAPVRINDDPVNPDKWHWFGTLAVAPNGRIDVVWLDTRNAANNTDSQLFYSYSFDGGVTWAANVAVSAPFNPFLGYPNQNKMGDYISMVSDSTGANVAYTATFNGEEDVYFVRVAPLPSSLLKIRSITRDSNGATIVFASELGKTYRCDYADAPGGPWHELQTNIAGTGGDVPVFDGAAANVSIRFYRFVLLP
jgi:hypothetical protein